MNTFHKYPCNRYHKDLAPDGREIKSAAQEAELGPGWVDTPAAFDPAYRPLTPTPEDGAPLEAVIAPPKEIIPYPAMRYARDGRTVTVTSVQEDRALDPAEWKDTPDPKAWPDLPPAPPSPNPSTVAPLAESFYLLNATEAARLVAGADTPQKLDVIAAAEEAHPKFPGGRASVLRAIAERREALTSAPA